MTETSSGVEGSKARTEAPASDQIAPAAGHWVAQLNTLAREMDDISRTIDPRAWPEVLAPLRKEYERIVVRNLRPEDDT